MSRIGALWAIALASQCCHLGLSQLSSDFPCPNEAVLCLGDESCSACLEDLQLLLELSVDTEDCGVRLLSCDASRISLKYSAMVPGMYAIVPYVCAKTSSVTFAMTSVISLLPGSATY